MAEGGWSIERISVTAVIVIISYAILSSLFFGNSAPTKETLLADVAVNPILAEHSKVFHEAKVEKVTDGVYMAMGYALANSILIEAQDGAIIVDVTETMQSGAKALAALREVSDSPIKAIIYTHNHADHVFGAKAFLEDPENPPEVWAHKTLPYELDRYFTAAQTGYKRAMRQFGVMIPKHVNSGIGGSLRYGADSEVGIIYPDHFLDDDEEDVTIAGLDVRLVHIPGETDDQIGVWIPSKKAFLCADDVYRAFPNLYAIRGTPHRDLMQWATSIDKIRALRPEYLVPSHTPPVIGEEKVYNLLTIYRDAIQLVHDQTVRFMNKGYHPDEIVKLVHLPPHLAKHPYLQELYGTVEWSVKGTYAGYMGWFNGDPVLLSPITPKERAQKTIEFAGGVGAVIEAAKQAMDKGEARWAMELASHVFILNPDHEGAKEVRLRALKSLAAEQTSANGRNYYLTVALEDHNFVQTSTNPKVRAGSIKNIRMKTLLKIMATNLKPEEVEGIAMTVVFNFTDTDECYTCYLRNSIIEVVDGSAEKWDLQVTTTGEIWREIVAQERYPAAAYLSGDLVVDGGLMTLKQFFDYIEKPE